MEDQLTQLQKDIHAINERDVRVEADKAWETSYFRIASISVVTYVVASFVLYFIGAHNVLLSAFVPTVGYFLSTQSLPFIKKWWINKFVTDNKKA